VWSSLRSGLVTLSQLRTFTAVARRGSLTAAARELGVSVPAVSAALASLRKEFGDELVIRSGGGTALTPGGLRLAAAAAEMVGIADQARRAVLEAREGSSVLRIAATNEIGEYAIGPLVDSFRLGRPRLRVAVTTAPAIELEAMLRDRRADVVLGPRLIAADIDSHPFLRVKTIVVAGPEHPLAGRSGVDPMLLRNEPWLVGPGGSDPATPLAAAARALAIPLERIREEPSHAGATMAIEMGRGIGPALAHAVTDELRRGALVRLDVPGTPFEMIWQLSTLARSRPEDAAAVLRRFIVQPEAIRAILSRSAGDRAERFRPAVHVTIWSD
jgi:molybdate transport repressor ModE-like protein